VLLNIFAIPIKIRELNHAAGVIEFSFYQFETVPLLVLAKRDAVRAGARAR